MPIANIQDTSGVEQKLQDILSSSDVDGRLKAIRELFVGILDYDNADQLVSLEPSGNAQLPKDAHVAARRDGVTVAYIPLDDAPTNRVNGIVVSAAAKTLGNILSDDLLLLFTNRDMDQLHIINPDLSGSRPKLQRLVAYRDQLQRTVPQQIANMRDNYGNKGKTLREAIAEVFNVEPVTKEFFGAYRKLFEAAEAQITGFTTAEEEQKHLFTQTLFNRLMFVYFLSRKGWLRFDGSADYLNALWQDYGSLDGDHDFYTARLKSLFFAGLNNPQSRNLVQDNPVLYRAIGDVPFLNGGLFEETDLDKRQDIKVPDEAIGHILTDLFDQFNFTVMESTPFDIEVAVDPEMLGKVFEELVTERHSSGAYYTPRPVVSFMCRESLKGYLEGQDTSLTSEAIARFVDARETEGIGVAQARDVARALAEVTVVDPACGSGAYLLGMMQELIELQARLFNVTQDAKSLYDLKLEIIQRNLYGVDLDDFAVNIAMLRMWLSLAIDYEGETPEPLPNLDFKVVCGDSLLGPDPSAGVMVQGTLGQDTEQFRRLGELKAEYLRASLGPDKERLKGDIGKLREEIRQALGVAAMDGVVDWRVEFAEVFAAQRGFDIAIANPPYVVVKDNKLRQLYREGIYGRMNSYGLFIQRNLQLLASNGQLFFINPRTLLTDRYFSNLRKVIRQKTELKGVVLIADRHNTFERVLQECIILHLSAKAKPSGEYRTNIRSIRIPTDLNDPQGVVPINSGRVLLGDEYDGAFYIGLSDFDYRVFEQMQAVGVKLDSFGIKAETGKVQFDKYKQYAQPTSAADACRLIWAENIQRYVRRTTRMRIGKEWLAKGVTSVLTPSITGAGIVTQRTSANEQPRRIIATLVTPDDVGSARVYSENGTNFIALGNESLKGSFLISALNSSLMEFVFRRLNSNVHVSAGEINSLPFPPIPSESKLAQIEALVSELLAMGGVDTSPGSVQGAMAIERELDLLIGSLYGFSPADVEQVQGLLPSYETVYGVAGY